MFFFVAIILVTCHAFGSVDWMQHQQMVILQGEPTYINATTSNFFLPKWESYSPDIVFSPQTTKDIPVALSWAKARGMTVSLAAGRHGSAGYCFSGNLAVDLRRLNTMTLAYTHKFAKGGNNHPVLIAGGGAKLGDLQNFLAKEGYITATGVCAGVGLAGWTLGGGYSPFSKTLGLGVDNVVEMEVVLPNGEVVRASEYDNDELFWALRGAGHQSFGVVTELTIRTAPLVGLLYYFVTLPLEEDTKFAVAALNKWYEFSYHNSTWVNGELSTYSVCFGREIDPNTPLVMGFKFMWPGASEQDMTEFNATLEPFIQFISDKIVRAEGPTADRPSVIGTFDDSFAQGVGMKNAADNSTLGLEEAKLGLYLKKEMDLEGFQQVIDAILQYLPLENNTSNIAGLYVVLEPYAGAALAPSPTDTAFYHRDVLGDIYFDVFTGNGDKYAFHAAETYLESLYQGGDDKNAKLEGVLALYTDGKNVDSVAEPQAYQNYRFKKYGENENRVSALRKYYAGNLCELVRLKQKYDPDLLMDFPQGIPLAIEGC